MNFSIQTIIQKLQQGLYPSTENALWSYCGKNFTFPCYVIDSHNEEHIRNAARCLFPEYKTTFQTVNIEILRQKVLEVCQNTYSKDPASNVFCRINQKIAAVTADEEATEITDKDHDKSYDGFEEVFFPQYLFATPQPKTPSPIISEESSSSSDDECLVEASDIIDLDNMPDDLPSQFIAKLSLMTSVAFLPQLRELSKTLDTKMNELSEKHHQQTDLLKNIQEKRSQALKKQFPTKKEKQERDQIETEFSSKSRELKMLEIEFKELIEKHDALDVHIAELNAKR